MNLSFKERKLVLKWFDMADEAGTLTDADLKLFDKISEAVDEDDYDSEDPLLYRHKKEKEGELEIDPDDLDSETFEDSLRFENMDGYPEEEDDSY